MKYWILTIIGREAEQEAYNQGGYGGSTMSPAPGQGQEPYAGQPFYPPPPGQSYDPNAAYAEQQQATAGAPIHPAYGYDQQGYVPPDPHAYTPPPGAAPYQAGNTGPRRADENVSADRSLPSGSSTSHVDDTNTANTPLYDPNGVPFYMSSGEGA